MVITKKTDVSILTGEDPGHCGQESKTGGDQKEQCWWLWWTASTGYSCSYFRKCLLDRDSHGCKRCPECLGAFGTGSE